MKSIIKIVSMVILQLGPQLALADSIADTYTTGDTLTATQLNNIKAAVNDNDSRVTTNATGISANAAGVTTNATGISSNAAGGTTNATGITNNAAGVTTNATGITNNAAGVATNSTGISANAAGVTTNSTGISANAAGGTTNATGITNNAAGVTTNATGITNNAAGITTNTTNITSNTNAITTNGTGLSSLNTRVTQLENGQAPSVPVNCVADSTAFLSTLIIDNTNYELSGICDGPIEIRGRRNVAILGAGVEPVDGIEGSGALFISTSMDILLNDLVLTALDLSNVLVVERNSFVEIENTSISGGDIGISVNTNATVQIQSGVIVDDFRNNGAYVGGNGGALRIFEPTSFTGSSTSINGATSGLTAFGGGTIFMTGLASGTVITPTTSLDGIFAMHALSAGDNGTIILEGSATINGSVVSTGSANIRILGAVDINGDVWADSLGSFFIQSASTITGNVFADGGASININNSTIDDGAGCCFFVQNNATVTLDNTTYTVANPQIGSGGRLNLYNGSSLSFPNNLVISRGAGVVLEDSDITGTGIDVSRYGTFTLPDTSNGANINLNVANITCTDAEGYDDGGLTLATAPTTVNCP